MPIAEPLLELSPRFTHVAETERGSVLISDVDSVVLDGRAVGELLRLLDGTRTAVEVAAGLSGAFKPQFVHLALLQLQADGIVRACTPSPEGPELEERALALWRAWEARGDLAPVTVAGGTARQAKVLLVEDYLLPDLRRIVESETAAKCTLVRPGPTNIWIGPTVGSPTGPCITCLQSRLRLNLPGRAWVAEVAPGQNLRIERLPSRVDPAVFQLLSEWLAEPRDAVSATDIWALDLEGGPPLRHSLPRLPQCPRCGNPDLQPVGAQFTLKGRTSRPGSAGGLRTRTPQETWDAYSPLIDALTGVVRSIEKVDVTKGAPVHVYTASHTNGLLPPTLDALQEEGRDQSGGKGVTDLDARVSALGESLERYSALHRGTEVVRRARFAELDAEALRPNDLMLFSEAQFRARESWNSGLAGAFQWVPEPYQDEAIAWSPVKSLVTGKACALPTAYVYLSYQGQGRRYCKSDSNGLAGGNCLEEAILQGFFELVERDAVALWWYNRGRVPAVEGARLDPAYVRELEEYYDALGRDMWTLDLTTDLGIPCIGAISSLQETGTEIIFGFGCHLDPAVALRRALTELNQMVPTVLR
ncbi:MAG: TOMM precursor leader peptide-binding protein, partial [Longimicrobiales bacterium]